MWGGDDPVMRERLVSATAFAAAAALFSVVGIALTAGFDGLIRDGSSVLALSPLLLAVPAAAVGAVAGPLLAQAADGLGAAVVGVGVTLGSALLYVVAGGAILFAMELLSGNNTMGQDPGGVIAAFFYAGAFALLGGLVASPLGALGGFIAWRQIRRSAPTEPV